MKRLILTSAWYCARIGRSSLALRELGAEGVSTHATKCRRPRMGASGAGGARVKHTGFRRHGAQSEAEHAMDMAVGRPSCANKLSRRDKRAVGPERVASRRGRRHGSAQSSAERLHFLFAQSRPGINQLHSRRTSARPRAAHVAAGAPTAPAGPRQAGPRPASREGVTHSPSHAVTQPTRFGQRVLAEFQFSPRSSRGGNKRLSWRQM